MEQQLPKSDTENKVLMSHVLKATESQVPRAALLATMKAHIFDQNNRQTEQSSTVSRKSLI